jgi:integrase
MLFKELTGNWLADLQERAKLGDLKPASLATFISRTNAHIRPGLGELEVEVVRNGVVKTFAENLSTKLGPKTTREVVALVKAILESHVNQDGEPLLELKWNNKFIYKGIKKIGKQLQPTISRDALNVIIKNHEIKVRDRVLIALAAATGVRVGELQALRINGDSTSTSWDQQASTLTVRQSVWRGQLQLPKTLAAIRQIELSTQVNELLIAFTAGRQAGEFMFATKSGKPLADNYISKHIMVPNDVPGMHSLRRYRASWADQQGCPRSLLAAWLGHSGNSEILLAAPTDRPSNETTSRYIKVESEQYRRSWAESLGTGLELSAVTS